MFKTAATKIAHNSTIPALAGNSDLRTLQDLITAEKAVLLSLQRLGSDFSKSAEALRIWGAGEGDDLGDILGASTALLNVFSTAITQYASHGHAMREQLKSIRTREEQLDELRRRRKALGSKAESAERKLSKMSPEHKNLAAQTEILNSLRSEIRTMDSVIMGEEAALGDYKRTSTKSWMGLKFGGLVECCEKGAIAGGYGRLVVAEIAEETTQPGMQRSMYYGHKTSESLLTEANKMISEVVLGTVPLNRQFQPLSRPGVTEGAPAIPSPLESSPYSNGYTSGVPPDYLAAPSQVLGSDQYFGHSPVPSNLAGTPTHAHFPSPPSGAPTLPYPQIDESARSLDDFAVPSSSGGPMNESGPSGGRFATFPVRNRAASSAPPETFDEPLSLPIRHDLGQSFSSTIADAFISPQGAPTYNENLEHQEDLERTPAYAPPLDPPPNFRPGLTVSDAQRAQNSVSQYSADAVLAYADDDGEGEQRGDRHVRFGAVSNMDDHRMRGLPPQTPVQVSQQPPPEVSRQQLQGRPSLDRVINEPAHPQHEPEPEAHEAHNDPDQISNPTRHLTREEEQALNIAAAHEVAREMDALEFSPPVPQDKGARYQSEQTLLPEPGRAPSPALSDLAPPSAPFARREPSPRPTIDLPPPSNRPTSFYSPPAQAYTQAHMTNFSMEPVSPLEPPPSAYDNSPTLPISPPVNTNVAPASYPTTPDSRPNVVYPRSIGLGTPPNRSSSSLVAPLPPGGRTISASAFRRPSPRMGSGDVKVPDFDTGPLVVRKRLPSSPYPAKRDAVPTPTSQSSHPLPQLPVASNPHPPSRGDLEEEYDYIGAYMNTGAHHDTGRPQAGQNPQGYGHGQYSTDLEGNGNLR